MKKRILYTCFGVMLVLLGGVICNYCKNVTQVFATQITEQQSSTRQEISAEGGIITGAGFYMAGETASLKFEVNPGYEFVGWYNIGTLQSPKNELLSTESEYTFTVSEAMNIEARYKVAEYSIELDSSLTDDFDLNYKKVQTDSEGKFDVNNLQYITDDEKITYQNVVEIEISKKSYWIYDLTRNDFQINDENLSENVICDITNELGFVNAKMYITITENVKFDIEYKYIEEFRIYAGDTNLDTNTECEEIHNVAELISVSGDLYEKSSYQGEYNDEDKYYVYYVNQQTIDYSGTLTVSFNDNAVYEFVGSTYKGEEGATKSRVCYVGGWFGHQAELNVDYKKKEYSVNFEILVWDTEITLNWTDLFKEDFELITLTAGENFTIQWDEEIQINNVSKYTLKDLYGYYFKGFGLNGSPASDGSIEIATITMDATSPADITVQIYFEYIQYEIAIETVYQSSIDSYFEDRIEITTSYNTPYLHAGSEVTLSATSGVYNINGWKESVTGGYLHQDYSYTFTFLPTSNNTNITYYLDVEYKSFDATFRLHESSYTYIKYDKVEVNNEDKIIIFKDSEGNEADITIQYTNYNINEGIVIINTWDDPNIDSSIKEALGQIIINDTTLSYGSPVNTSISTTQNGNIKTYNFNKSEPFAQLEVGVTKYLKIVKDGSGKDVVQVYGDVYTNKASTESKKLFESAPINSNGYMTNIIDGISYNVYSLPSEELYVYYNNDSNQYSYIEYKGVKFQYNNNDRFEMIRNLLDTSIQTPYSSIKFTINNVTCDDILFFMSSNKNTNMYGFVNHQHNNSSVSSMLYIGGAEKHVSVTRINENYELSAYYKMLVYSFNIEISDDEAYSNTNINLWIDGESKSTNFIELSYTNVTDNALIKIQVVENKINTGYKYSGAYKNNLALNLDYVLEFSMSSEYHEQTIELRFDPITYYITTDIKNEAGEDAARLVEYTLINTTDSEMVSNGMVHIKDAYKITTSTVEGYYISQAYFMLQGNDAVDVVELRGENNDGNSIQEFSFSQENFIKYIINNADQNNIVTLYLIVSVDTLSFELKYYSDINKFAQFNLPKIYYAVCDTNSQIEVDSELWQLAGGLTATNAQTIEFNYGQYISFKYSDLIEGFKDVKFAFYNNQNLSTQSNITIPTQLKSSNLQCTATILLKTYTIKFNKILQGEEYNSSLAGQLGGVTTTNNTAQMLDNIAFAVTANGGYKYNRAYYKTAEGEQVVENGFQLMPESSAITGNNFIVFVEYVYSQINISIENNFDQLANKLGIVNIATQQISLNGANVDTESIQVAINDTLIVIVETNYQGLALLSGFYAGNKEVLSNTINENITETTCQFGFEIQFTQNNITQLGDNVVLKNTLKERIYNLVYSYNFIDSKLGVQLVVEKFANGSPSNITQSADTKYEDTINFGSQISLGYHQDIELDFIGYSINNQLQTVLLDSVSNKLVINSIEDWVYLLSLTNNNIIEINLIVGPQIILDGGIQEENVYTFTSVYNGLEQTIEDANGQVIINGVQQNSITIRYYLNGIEISPKHVGEYEVKIAVQYYGQEFIYGQYGEDADRNIAVRLLINQKELTVQILDKITKTYDGGNIINDVKTPNWKSVLKLNGLCGEDGTVVTLNFDTIYAYYNSFQAGNKVSITVEGLQISGTNAIANNYYLKVETRINDQGDNIYYQIFDNAGSITKRVITVSGLQVSNKVYNENGEVEANVDNLNFANIIEADRINIDKTKIHFYCENFEIGKNKAVTVDFSKAITSDILNNYNITYIPVTIDIYNNKLEKEVYGVGVFTVEDRNNLCLIPFDSQLTVNMYSREHELYREIYPQIEGFMASGDRFEVFYELSLKVGGIDKPIKTGLYITLPNANLATTIVASKGEGFDKYTFEKEEGRIVLQLSSSEVNPKICYLQDVEFLPLWLIITIIAVGLAVIGLAITIFIVVRRKREMKISSRNKI